MELRLTGDARIAEGLQVWSNNPLDERGIPRGEFFLPCPPVPLLQAPGLAVSRAVAL
jgi:hypothetical protein